MNDELGFENIVQGGLHRGSTGIVADCLAHEVLDQLLPGMRLGRGLHVVELVDLDPVEGHEGLLVQARQRRARGFHPKDFLVLAGGIPSPTLSYSGVPNSCESSTIVFKSSIARHMKQIGTEDNPCLEKLREPNPVFCKISFAEPEMDGQSWERPSTSSESPKT